MDRPRHAQFLSSDSMLYADALTTAGYAMLKQYRFEQCFRYFID